MKLNFLISYAFFLLFCTIFVVQAQTTVTQNKKRDKEDIIYLKDGSIIRGQLLNIDNEEKVKIEIVGGSIFAFDTGEIDSIGQVVKKGIIVKKRRPIIYRNKGFYNHTSTPIRSGITGQGSLAIGLGIHSVSGYQFNQYLAGGVGIGVDLYDGTTLIPVYGDFRGYIFDKSGSLFYNVNLGYGFFSHTNNWFGSNVIDGKGGLFTQGIIGYRFPSRWSSHLTLSMGVTFQKAQLTVEEWFWGIEPTISTQNISFRRTFIALGILF